MENWTWGLSLIALTIIIHATGIALLAFVVRRFRNRMQSEGTRRRALAILIAVIGAVGLLLAVDSMTARGASGLMLERGWRMMGALEAADGLLLFGISTAFIFAVMQLYAPPIHRQPPSH